MNALMYDSDEFRRELQKDIQHAAEVAFLRSVAQPGMVVIEAGACNGITTLALADAVGEVGHVYAFEPATEEYRQLQDNLARNGAINVSAYNLALSDHTGRIPFYKREGGTNGIIPANGGEMFWVEATSIAEFLLVQQIERIDLIDIDCVGSEFLVLKGAHSTLQRHAPQILCHVYHEMLRILQQSADDVARYLRRCGYDTRFLRIEEPDVETIPGECSHVHAFEHSPRDTASP